ncbi:MAG: hypothetical protein MJ062_02165 [Oscillospiraceae bacterium]|nr:hypothetical protein [Oscillospiraceae bacterium]
MTTFRGVSKTVIELANPNSDYFERVVLYLKPNLSRKDRNAVRTETQKLLSELSPRKPLQIGKRLLMRIFVVAASGACGAALMAFWLK